MNRAIGRMSALFVAVLSVSPGASAGPLSRPEALSADIQAAAGLLRSAEGSGVVAARASRPAEPVRFTLGPDASPVVAAILAADRGLHPWLWPGWRAGEAVSKASCRVEVDRPVYGDPAKRGPDNRIFCRATVGEKGAEREAVESLSLRDAAIDAWGNRFTKGNPVSFKGEMAERLTAAIEKAYRVDKKNPIYWYAELWGPPGKVAQGFEFIAINHKPERLSAGAIICSRDKEMDMATGMVTVVSHMCVLMDNDE